MPALQGCLLGEQPQERVHAPLQVHLAPQAEYFLQHHQDVLEQLRSGVGEQFQDCGAVLGEDVGDVLGIVLADGADHSDTLVAFLPIAFDEGVELLEECLVEFGRRREAVVVEGSGV